jgi:hypothetical protein
MICSNIFNIILPKGIIDRYETNKQLRDPFFIMKESNLNNAIVFLKSVPGKSPIINRFVQNSLEFKGKVLFARDLKEKILN